MFSESSLPSTTLRKTSATPEASGVVQAFQKKKLEDGQEEALTQGVGDSCFSPTQKYRARSQALSAAL